MKILLSIKPEFVEMIFNGTKKYEFRRSIFKNNNVNTVVVYASSPIKKVIGEFMIDKIIEDEIFNLWEKTKLYSGIKENYFLKYFQNKEKGYAIKIKNAKKYLKPLSIKENFNVTPPQSFVYLEGDYAIA
jgi:predicted transcriptional regulator